MTEEVGKVNYSSRSYLALMILLLVVSVIALWSGLLRKPFYYDDSRVIAWNDQLGDLSNLKGIFTPQKADLGEGTLRPIVTASYFLDFALYGKKSIGYHLTNLLIHLGTTLALFWLILAWRKPNIAFLTALLFGIHPLTANTIAFPGFREDALAAMFALLSLGAFMRWLNRESSFFHAVLSCLTFALALLSKENTILLPLAFAYLAWVHIAKNKAKIASIVPNLMPIALISLTHIFLYFLTSRSMPHPNYFGTTYLDRLFTIGRAFGRSIWMVFLPLDQKLVYDFFGPYYSFASAFGLLLMACMSVIILLLIKRRSLAATGGIIFLASYLPASNLLVPIWHVFDERFLYLPTAGMIATMVPTIATLFEKVKFQQKITLTALVMIAISFSTLSILRIKTLADPSEAWAEATQRSPGNPLAWNSLASIDRQNGDLSGCLHNAQKAIELIPDYENARENLLTCHYQRGDFPEVLTLLNQSDVNQESEQRKVLRSLTLIQMKRADEALPILHAVLNKYPNNLDAIKALAAAYIILEKCKELDAFLNRLPAEYSQHFQILRNQCN